jgi:hypothetical protein
LIETLYRRQPILLQSPFDALARQMLSQFLRVAVDLLFAMTVAMELLQLICFCSTGSRTKLRVFGPCVYWTSPIKTEEIFGNEVLAALGYEVGIRSDFRRQVE